MLTNMLSTNIIPQYFNIGRLVPLSKKRNQDTVRLEDVRPIVIKSHLTKICENAILNKIKSTNS